MGGSENCTTSVALPVLDTLLSGYLLLNMMLNINRPASSFGMDGQSVKSGAIAFGAIFTGLTAVSAGVGYSRVSACKDYLDGQDDWTPAPRRRRPVPPPPRAPVPAGQTPSPPMWPAPGAVPGAPGPAYPPPPLDVVPPAGATPGTAAPSGTVAPPAQTPPTPPTQTPPPQTPLTPAAPPAPQIEDDEAPRPGRPRSLLVLPATLPMLAAMPRLDEKDPPSTAPRFSELPRFAHPWHLPGSTVR